MINQFEKFSYKNLLDEALSKIPDHIDKREGSIIYDALAPACYHLATVYMNLFEIQANSFIDTAYDEFLDLKVAERMISRRQATNTIVKGIFKFTDAAIKLKVGMRFSSIGDNILTYSIIEETDVENEYLLKCEVVGTVGNNYIGDLLPISHINNLVESKITSIHTPGMDLESDSDLRDRYKLSLNKNSFGGNIDQYREVLKSIDGVGAVQVYPTWNGGGTVKCSIIDSSYKPISSEFINTLKEIIDPQEATGNGLGKAPIGHVVTISTPDVLNINITGNIQLLTGYTIEQLQEDIEKSINDYLNILRENWAVGDNLNNYSCSIYISQITAAILKVFGVANVTNIKINNNSNDLNLIQSAELQQIPLLKSVVFQ